MVAAVLDAKRGGDARTVDVIHGEVFWHAAELRIFDTDTSRKSQLATDDPRLQVAPVIVAHGPEVSVPVHQKHVPAAGVTALQLHSV